MFRWLTDFLVDNKYGNLIIGAALAVAGLWVLTGEVKCGDKVMRKTDMCTTVSGRGGSSTTRTYSEQMFLDNIWASVFTAIGAILLIIGVVRIIRSFTRKPAQ